MEDKLLMARSAKKTINYIEKNIYNFPNEYKILKDKIINACYNILENIYRANINQNINDKKEVIVQIKMLNFYLKQILDKGLISNKKFLSYSRYLEELHRMVLSWFKYETKEQFI